MKQLSLFEDEEGNDETTFDELIDDEEYWDAEVDRLERELDNAIEHLDEARELLKNWLGREGF